MKTLEELQAEHTRLKEQDVAIYRAALELAIQGEEASTINAALCDRVVHATEEWRGFAAFAKAYFPHSAKERNEADALYSSAMVRIGREVVEDAE